MVEDVGTLALTDATGSADDPVGLHVAMVMFSSGTAKDCDVKLTRKTTEPVPSMYPWARW